MPAPPFGFFDRSPAMTLSDDVGTSTQRERSIPVLETERLTLRAPRHEDVKAIAVLANDRRIAENTTRIPHPYRVADAEHFVADRQPARRRSLLRHDAGRHADRRLRRRSPRRGRGARLLARRRLLGPWLHDRSRARRHRLRVRRSPARGAAVRARGSAIRLRAACSRNAHSNGPACA